jgi:acyl transferase domain-containing protein
MVEVSSLTTVQHACVVHGSFIYGAQLFDNRAFGVSPSEAAAMAPEQRLLLQVSVSEHVHSS